MYSSHLDIAGPGLFSTALDILGIDTIPPTETIVDIKSTIRQSDTPHARNKHRTLHRLEPYMHLPSALRVMALGALSVVPIHPRGNPFRSMDVEVSLLPLERGLARRCE